MKETKPISKKVSKIVFWVSLVVFIISLIVLGYILLNSYIFNEKYNSGNPPENTSSKVTLVKNPINFVKEQEVNGDIYAWIKIPNTAIDYPVVQATDKDDNFYLNHGIDKKYKFAGAIYSEKLNEKDFSDPNTVLYGHNMLNGTMFRDLHKFKKKEFFDENKYIYIYTPGHILTYEICAAYRYDNRHILNSFDFTDEDVFEEYLETVKNPKSMICNTRAVELNKDSKILTLSTCISNDDYRYLVQGVLINDQPTK